MAKKKSDISKRQVTSLFEEGRNIVVMVLFGILCHLINAFLLVDHISLDLMPNS